MRVEQSKLTSTDLAMRDGSRLYCLISTAAVCVSHSPNQASRKPSTNPSQFIFHLHGSDDIFCRRVAAETHYTVLDIEYRLAPEHPFPAAPHDAADALKYVLSRPDLYDNSRIAVSGFSAGGNLALGLVLAQDFPRDTIQSLLQIGRAHV